ncbi:50S ribosome-binding GTPase [Nostocaceae cyanobacterium CENA369]|uniref:50S ribosome-binding GTPase n=1 Tax=Dendronalium phyllosphericum CENA369 TaxID=1725256 RepID=A0A8J7I3J3_9NOST|nr:GTPase [Dendronalium phyllosphericum]MBH8573038.1 50S ribosome-binding GTPase [Dendronalium phyllosphericum CENA369]
MSRLISEQINYQFLLLTHMVCADEQIHSEEAKTLRELAQKANMGIHTIEEMEKILNQDENFISVENVARQIQQGEQSEAMRQMLAIAYIDGYFSPLEREMIEHIAKVWNWSNLEIERLLEQTEKFGRAKLISNNRDEAELSVGARLLKGIDSVLSRALVDNLAKVAPDNVGRKIDQLRKEILLAGPEYENAIQQCTVVATEDYKFAENSLKSAYSALRVLAKNLKRYTEEIQQKTSSQGQANTAKEVAKQLESTRNALIVEALKELEGVHESLRAKQRALKHFSIAFIGKTKAGKSTLHAIITGDGWDAIGVGKQRTTRFNRVYEWKNIRIIDTPGIGAPGGKSDEEIAESIIDESDVICYVVTNDSIQETEFKFLQLLKEKAKPLIILLNVKNNLRDTRRLEHFLKDSNKLFVMDSASGLGGHIERIRRYAKQHYANDYFDIIPVMLLAAQMSRESEHQQNKSKLFKASRIQDFLDAIRVSLVEHGGIRRSQTLLGSTVGAIEAPNKWVTQQLQAYQNLSKNLKSIRNKFQEEIAKASISNQEYLIEKINTVFKDIFDTIQPFAEENWDNDENQMKSKWEGKLKILKFQDRLNNAFEESGKKFNHEVEELLEEIGTELQLMARLVEGNFHFKKNININFKDMLRIGAAIISIAASITMLFAAPPLGIIMVIGTIISGITNFFKSQKEKQREAAEKISQSLNKQLKEYQQKTLSKAEEEFSCYCDAVALNINGYFNELIQGIEKINNQLAKTKNQLDSSANYLNRAYAKRITDWCSDKYEQLTDECIIETISKVERNFGRNIKIQVKSVFKQTKIQEEINQIIQENVYISLIDPSK